MNNAGDFERIRPVKTLSVFAGAGGLDIGFHQSGYDIVASVEIEQSFCETLKKNVGTNRYFGAGLKVICQDIISFDPRPYADLGIECVIGGPPCQTFSAAGRRSGGVIGTSDIRGRLFKRYCDILAIVRPQVFVFENVYGLPGANGGGPWREIVGSFRELGYSLRAEVVDAADYGVPQHRERLIMVGSRAGEFEFPMPTHGPDSDEGPPLVSAMAAIRDLQDKTEPCHAGVGGLYGHLLPLVPPGLNYAFFTAEMGHPEPVFAWRSKFHDLLYKVNPNEPCRTIKAHPGKFTGPFHWKNRHFTIAELKRLQTFPDDYEILGSESSVLEQIGNSVPPRLAHVIASSVRDQLLRSQMSLSFPVRPFGFISTFRQRQRQRSHKFKEIARAAIRKQYGVKRPSAPRASKKFDERYFVRRAGHFEREQHSEKIRATDPGQCIYEVRIEDGGAAIGLSFVRTDARARGLTSGLISISGLSKYLGRIDSLTAHLKILDISDVFHAWASIEQALVSRSRFFTLIDIYGHYANRGDTVRIKCDYGLDQDWPLHRSLDYFGDSLCCGEFMTFARLARELSISEREIKKMIGAMRSERFDIRTNITHPIIGTGRVICTYPFPLLSAKALVESRAQFLSDESLPRQTRIAV